MNKKSTLKKSLLYLGGGLTSLIIILAIGLIATGNTYIYRAFMLTYMKGEKTANIDDYTDFDNHKINADKHIEWQPHPEADTFKLTDTLAQALAVDDSIAFAIIKDGKLLYENYWQGYTADSKTNSFSMAKSINTMLYLKAVEDGYISRHDAPITELLPEYSDSKFAQNCTLADLSAMTAGYDWVENYYTPFNPTTKAYYGNDVTQQVLSIDFTEPCGRFKYLSGNTQLLGIALQRALQPHGYTISSYLEETFWQPLGMKNEAYWSLDGDKKIEKTYCCLNAGALDFAKFGQLLLNGGSYGGKQLLSKKHVELMITPNHKAFEKGEPVIHGHSIWTDMDSPIPFYALLGHLGQRVIVIPDDNMIIVRLGKSKPQVTRPTGFHLENSDISFYVHEVAQSVAQSNIVTK